MTLRQPHNQYSNMRVPQPKEQEETLAEGRINGGMVTTIDPADIQNNQFVVAQNVTIRYDKTTRRHGLSIYSPAKPDSNKILGIVPYERFDTTVSLIRFTPDSIYSGTSASWNAVTGVLTGGSDDRFTSVIANDRFFFANNGADYIQEIDPTALTFARLGNAPKFKYITSFNNRVLGAYEVGSPNNPIKVGWSGNLNFDEWDASVDPSAGFNLLIDSPSDYADPITGIFGLESIALILRQRSVWIVEKQPVATSPFIFNALAPGIGCDAPYSAIPIQNGLAWFDLRTGAIYAYKVGMQAPERISTAIENLIIGQIEDPNTLFAGYNVVQDEYTLCIPSTTSTTVRQWTYNFRTKAWWYDEIDNISALNNIDYAASSLVINELVGTIDSLSGDIDDLTNNTAISSRFYGSLTGELMIQDKLADSDGGVLFNSVLQSKLFEIPRHSAYLTALRLEYFPYKAGSFTVSYSKDGGNTWKVWKDVVWTGSDTDKRKRIVIRKHIKADMFMWKIEGNSGLYDLLEYELFIITSEAESQSR